MLQRQAGYFVGHVGKWQYANPNHKVEAFFNWTSLFEGRHWLSVDGKSVHATDLARDKAIQFLRERPQDRPFALTVAFFPPKALYGDRPWLPKNESMHLYANDSIPEPKASWDKLPYFFHNYENFGRIRWRERFEGKERYQTQMKNYYRLITEVDAASRQIVKELENQGILDETIIIFTTDNGYFHGEHGLGKIFSRHYVYTLYSTGTGNGTGTILMPLDPTTQKIISALNSRKVVSIPGVHSSSTHHSRPSDAK
jgi:arylsulfatase A-like enzyme